jgi:uncharacterized protein Yka (UPF0111/DUF47 family)
MRRFAPVKLLRELSRRSDADMTQLLLEQVGVGIQGARLARQAVCGALPSAAAREQMAAIEHHGDEARELLVTAVATSFVTPFDREDVFRVSRSIDDVVDNLRDFVRELDLFQAADHRCAPVIDAVIDGLERLERALAGAASNEVHARTLAAKKACNNIRRAYERQLAELFDGDVTADMLRRRELLRRLDVVGLRLGEAADAFADAAMKRAM